MLDPLSEIRQLFLYGRDSRVQGHKGFIQKLDVHIELAHGWVMLQYLG